MKTRRETSSVNMAWPMPTSPYITLQKEGGREGGRENVRERTGLCTRRV